MQVYLDRKKSKSSSVYMGMKSDIKNGSYERSDIFSNGRFTNVYKKYIPKYFPLGLPTIKK